MVQSNNPYAAAKILGWPRPHDLKFPKRRDKVLMSMDQFPFSEFSKKTLEECQKWWDENYQRNTEKMNQLLQIQNQNK